MSRFDTFIVCEKSRRAFEAAVAVATALARVHNPLVLYGRSGSGKTHLLRAIEENIREIRGKACVTRTAAARLTDQMIAAFRSDHYPEFRRSAVLNDAILLDDLDCIADRQRTLEEFWLLIEEWVRSGVQVVITTSAQPKTLGLTPDRVVQYFPQTLVAKLHVAREVTARRDRARAAFQQALR